MLVTDSSPKRDGSITRGKDRSWTRSEPDLGSRSHRCHQVGQTWWRGWGACTGKSGVAVEATVAGVAIKDANTTGTADGHEHAVGFGRQITSGDSRATGFAGRVTSEQNCSAGTLGFWGDDECNTWSIGFNGPVQSTTSVGVSVPVGITGATKGPNGTADHFAFSDWHVWNTSVATTVGVVRTCVVTRLIVLGAAWRAFERIAWLWWHEAINIQRVSTVLAGVSVDSKVIGRARPRGWHQAAT